MCGRFGFFELAFFIEQLRQLELPFAEAPGFRYAVRYNIAPESDIVTLFGENGNHSLGNAYWGMIPHWATSMPKVRPINARAESLAVKPCFRHMLNRHHCLIPSSGFFEWKRVSGEKKQPWYVHRSDGKPMAIAGLWDRWQPPDATLPAILSCTIVTTEANREMKPVHDRMPVIIEPEHWKEWLDAGASCSRRLLVPPSDGILELYPVSTKVNNPRHLQRDCIERVDSTTFF